MGTSTLFFGKPEPLGCLFRAHGFPFLASPVWGRLRLTASPANPARHPTSHTVLTHGVEEHLFGSRHCSPGQRHCLCR